MISEKSFDGIDGCPTCLLATSPPPLFRSTEQASDYSEPMASSRLPQGQVSQSYPQPPALHPSACHPHPRHSSDSAAPQNPHWDHREWEKDRDHPLTRLEIALAEVQRCASPNSVISSSSHDNGGAGGQGPVRSLSVLEKVSCFERRERSGKQRSHSAAKAPDNVSEPNVRSSADKQIISNTQKHF